MYRRDGDRVNHWFQATAQGYRRKRYNYAHELLLQLITSKDLFSFLTCVCT